MTQEHPISPPLQPPAGAILLSISTNLPRLHISHQRNNTIAVPFCLLISPGVTSSGSIHGVDGVRTLSDIPSHRQTTFCLPPHQLTDGHLGRFHLSPIVSNGAMTTGVRGSVQGLAFDSFLNMMTFDVFPWFTGLRRPSQCVVRST